MSQFRNQLTRWCTGATQKRDPWIINNLSPSWSFHRDPLASVNDTQNIESNEYACIILDALSYLPEAKQYGLVLSSHEKKVLKAWSKRAISAYFTHSGYLNWDTGLYLDRWHLGRYWAWSLGGLFAIMLNDEQGDATDAQHAKWLFDRALATYTRWAKLAGQAVPQTPTYPVKSTLTPNPPDMAARFVFLATRAVWRDIEKLPNAAPPALYAYDPGIGRLTVTTPLLQLRDRRAEQRRVPLRRARPVPLLGCRPARGGEHRRQRRGELRRGGQARRRRGRLQLGAAQEERTAAADDDEGPARQDHQRREVPVDALRRLVHAISR